MKSGPVSDQELIRCSQAVESLFGPMVEQFRGDWTSTKDGQSDMMESFECFLDGRKSKVGEGQALGIVSIGDLSDQIPMDALKEFLQAYYSLPVVSLDSLRVASIPSTAWRTICCYAPQADGNEILNEVLQPLKEQCAGRWWGVAAITHEDLMYDPKDGEDYVYGLSNSDIGAAVVSTRRIWQPAAVGFELSRLRFLKLVTHEIGHLFHLRHCLTHACVMNGVETVDQIDRHPLEACPDCMVKICWTCQVHPKVRYERLAEACERLGMSPETNLYRGCLGLLST